MAQENVLVFVQNRPIGFMILTTGECQYAQEIWRGWNPHVICTTEMDKKALVFLRDQIDTELLRINAEPWKENHVIE